ncbi:hypothetical protein F4779DRAFT_427609 [Xylariaceae sp. FL0662B]|nr:hypothetical protein F4779DRAFT_427609 [Xylariaceae sp. FL0662B]
MDAPRSPISSNQTINAKDTAPSASANGTSRRDVSGPGRLTFMDLPFELREMVWKYALPESRVFNVLVYTSAELNMQLLGRESLKLPLAHVCFESRRVVQDAGYILAFRDEDEPDDPGVWFNPYRDVIERTLWGPCDFRDLKYDGE